MASELVTDAVRHGARPADDELVELVVWAADGHYWLAVSDPGGRKPRRAHPDAEAEAGRGLVLVDALSEAWAVVPRPGCGRPVVAGSRPHGG